MKDFKEIIELLNQYGIQVNVTESNYMIFFFSLSILILSCVTLLCFINIVLYIGVIYLIEKKDILNKLSKYRYLTIIINLYNIYLFKYL